MSRIVLSARAVVVLLCGTPAALAAAIDFDDVRGTGERSISPDRYLASGVRLNPGLFVDGPSSETNTPPNWLGSSDGLILIEFNIPGTKLPGATDSVTFYFFSRDPVPPGQDGLTAGIFDARRQLLGSAGVPTGVTSYRFSFSRPTADVHLVIVADLRGSQGIDTLGFGTIVPEPGSIPLLIAGALLSLRRPSRRPLAVMPGAKQRRCHVRLGAEVPVLGFVLLVLSLGADHTLAQAALVLIGGDDLDEHGRPSHSRRRQASWRDLAGPSRRSGTDGVISSS